MGKFCWKSIGIGVAVGAAVVLGVGYYLTKKAETPA